MQVVNQEEFNRVNSKIDKMILAFLFKELKEKSLNHNDFIILSRSYSLVNSALENENEFKFLSN